MVVFRALPSNQVVTEKSTQRTNLSLPLFVPPTSQDQVVVAEHHLPRGQKRTVAPTDGPSGGPGSCGKTASVGVDAWIHLPPLSPETRRHEGTIRNRYIMYQHLQRGHLAGSPYTTKGPPLDTPWRVLVRIMYLSHPKVTRTLRVWDLELRILKLLPMFPTSSRSFSSTLTAPECFVSLTWAAVLAH